MKKRRALKYYPYIILFFLIIFSSLTVPAGTADSLGVDDSESVRIDSIKISGNELTEQYIITRELTFKEGDYVTGKVLRFNRERIYSLDLFNRVEFQIKVAEQLNILDIQLTESWYLYPIPFVYAENGDYEKATFGINLLYKNFRGRNEILRARIGFGYDPYYSIFYENPALFHESGIGITVGLGYGKFYNRNKQIKKIIGEDFQYKSISQIVSVSKRINQFNLIYLTLGYTYTETPFYREGINASNERIDRTVLGGIGYYYDSRDLKQYSREGLYILSQYIHQGFGIRNIDYNDIEIDFREYSNIIEQLSGKWRIMIRRSFGKFVPFYDYSYLGYLERVRGHYNDLREGKGFLITSFELSYPLVREWNVKVKLPLLPESLTSFRIGIYLSGFADAGDTFNDGRSISINHFYSGYGLGLTFLFLPYNAVRFEYAINELGRGELLIGTGFSF